MAFEQSDIPYLDTSAHNVELSRFTCLGTPLRGLGLPVLPLFLMAGGTAVGATLAGWLQKPSWSAGEYNDFMRVMDDTFKEWDKEGWENGCWKNEPLRRQFLSLWRQFSKHYKEHPTITRLTVPPWVLDSEEKPARRIMQQMRMLGERLEKDCRIYTGSLPDASDEEPDEEETTLDKTGSILKWAAIGGGVLLALNIVKTVRELR